MKIISANTVIATFIAALHKPTAREEAEFLRSAAAAALREGVSIAELVAQIPEKNILEAGHTVATFVTYLEVIQERARKDQREARAKKKVDQRAKRWRRKHG